ncbi:MAG: beta-lactamase hydrolase domain-containing protein [Pseudomonadota bacterium]
MNRLQYFVVSLALTFSSLVLAAELPALDMKAASELSPELITGGQPSRADLEMLKAAGVTTVINLRAASEDAGYDEAAAAKALGLNYVSIPIAGAGDITAGNAAKLDAALRAADGKTLLHCASSNRVGALLALRAAAAGQSEEEAISFGKSAGMTSLEAVARAQIKAAAPCNPMMKECP